MSSRNFRKLCGGPALPAPDSDDSDAEYDPFNKRPQQGSAYAGLDLGSSADSDNAQQSADEEEEEEPTVVQGGARRKKINKKKGKKNKAAYVPENRPAEPYDVAGPSGCNGHGDGRRRSRPQMEELDEIDRSVMEVNALLGTPPPAPVSTDVELDEQQVLLVVSPKHLNVAYELKRLFGPEEPEEVRQRQKDFPYLSRILRRVMVAPNSNTNIYNFKKTGLSMSIHSRDKGITYFVYDHDLEHQKDHQAFLLRYLTDFLQSAVVLSLEDARNRMHVEPLLEIADTLFRMDEYGKASEIVENVVTYLQFIAHPSFNLSNPNVRLLFKFLENRPFHVAMFKYMYMLSNKACHRTALEIAKMLLNLDPSDPMALVFVIDVLALRAREHQWLIDIVHHLSKQRRVEDLFNIKYSYALALFHVAKKNKKEFTEADNALETAVYAFPQVALKLMELVHANDPRIINHDLFKDTSQTSGCLTDLIEIYGRLVWARWREPAVLEWFTRNITRFCEDYGSRDDVRERVAQLTARRLIAYEMWPGEISRHVSMIRSMANLLIDKTLPQPNTPRCPWDPVYDSGVNRYAYQIQEGPLSSVRTSNGELIFRFFSSLLPNTVYEPPVD